MIKFGSEWKRTERHTESMHFVSLNIPLWACFWKKFDWSTRSFRWRFQNWPFWITSLPFIKHYWFLTLFMWIMLPKRRVEQQNYSHSSSVPYSAPVTPSKLHCLLIAFYQWLLFWVHFLADDAMFKIYFQFIHLKKIAVFYILNDIAILWRHEMKTWIDFRLNWINFLTPFLRSW